MEDKEIINLYYNRDEQAIKQTDIKYGLLCRAIAMNILSKREDAEECVNDTYLAAWNSMPPQKPTSLKTFLGRITRNISISKFRANHAKKRYSSLEIMLSELDDCIPDTFNVEEQFEETMLSEYISNWLDSLNDEDRAIFVRRYWYGDSCKTLARKCGFTQNKMASHMFKLRVSLKSFLEKEGVSF